tara:strand:+ start:21 stop:806 length:786 start_codon:yes stop_codon:yes gene_type:complete
MNIDVKNKIDELLDIMTQLRDEKKGCPWDIKQNFDSLAPYTIEEAYEVAEAIQHKNFSALKEELGDLLFHVIFHAQLAKESQAFEFADILECVCNKLIQRHPHVFSSDLVSDKESVKDWEGYKRVEHDEEKGILSGIGSNQPAMNQAYKLQKKAASVGFDWKELPPVMEKLEEEIEELKEEIKLEHNQQRIEEELGDVLFSCINMARHLEISPEWSLRLANERFTKRFTYIERLLNESGEEIENCSSMYLEALWNQAKEFT